MAQQFVSEFYGKTVQKTEDLAYDACCVASYTAAQLAAIPDAVKAKRYGCGSPIPAALDGCTVLDLGCGAGIDVYVAAQMVGETGKVIGVDMTPEQLAVARDNLDEFQANLAAQELAAPAIELVEATIEDLPLATDSVDVVISNCVINLSTEKEKVFEEIHRVLKPGGEFYISDIVADRRIPARLAANQLLWSECLSGAAYAGDLRRTMAAAGFADVRVVSSRRLSDQVEGIGFWSRTLRGFKVGLEDACEDYGQVAVYRGTIPGHERAFDLDETHHFPAGSAVRVCRNTADMLRLSRYGKHFAVSEEIGHLGEFDCGPVVVAPAKTGSTGGSCC